MSETIYLRGQCEHCREAIEFPAESTGQSTACPLCNRTTILAADGDVSRSHRAQPSAPHSTRRGKSSRAWIFGAIAALALGGVGSAFLFTRSHPSQPVQSPSELGDTPERFGPALTAPTNASVHVSASNAPATTPAAPRSLSDLKAGPVTLEKAKGSSLVYAVGVLRNESDHQRFGVTIEVELTDAGGNNAGLAKDYRAVIEPRQEWRFRALILNSKAVRGSVTRIHEE